MKLTADLTNAYAGCEVCGQDTKTPYVYDPPEEGRVCLRHLFHKFKETRDRKGRARIMRLLMPVSKRTDEGL
jgi:hypothetical protein